MLLLCPAYAEGEIINTSPPSISGTFSKDNVITAREGEWTYDEETTVFSYEYQWQRAEDANGTGLEDIPQATDQTYTLTSNDNGKYIRVKIICTVEGIPAETSTATSAFRLIANASPVITQGVTATIIINEDAAPENLILNATDADDDTINWSITKNVSNGILSNTDLTGGSVAFTYDSNDNYYGSDSFIVEVNDGNGGTKSITVNITVNAVNDIPTFIKGANQEVNEDSGAKTVNTWASGISPGLPTNESTQTLELTVTNDKNDLFSVQPAISMDGKLTYTSAPDANGIAAVTVALKDNGGNDTFTTTFTIRINAVNDVPSFTKGADQTVHEDSGAHTVNNWASAISKGPSDESYSQSLTFTVTNDNHSLFSVQPAIITAGELKFTIAPDKNGTATVTVVLKDNGGTFGGGKNTAATQTFTITVNSVNAPPSFTKGADETVNEDSGVKEIDAWATAISKGGINESSQILLFEVTNNKNDLFSTQPAITADGKLSYTPAADANGTATVTVTLKDDGGTTNGGSDSSATQTFTITVNPVNDIPTFIKGADQIVNEDSGTQIVNAWATAINKGAENEDPQTLAFNVTNDNNDLFSVQPAITPTGELTYIPKPDISGTAKVTVVLKDDGGTANGGVDKTALQTFTITVNPVNDAPSFMKGANQTLFNNTGTKEITDWAISMSKGPVDESAQVLDFIVTNDKNELFEEQPTINVAGTLIYKVKTNAFGIAKVKVKLHDDGGTERGGMDTSAEQIFKITVLADGELTLEGTLLDKDTKQAISGAEVRLLDKSGKLLATVITVADGAYKFEKMVEGPYILEVYHSTYSKNYKEINVNFASGVDGIVRENIELVKFSIVLKANPSSIIGDGIEETILTTTVLDRNGISIQGVEVTFDALVGNFYAGRKATTGSDGRASIPYRSIKIQGTDRQVIPVTATVSDPVRQLYGVGQILITFEPGAIKGIVIDNNTEKPIKGAIVVVSKDFDGDGIVEFSASQITEEDGKYKIAVPKGNVVYDIQITKLVVIGNESKDVTFEQKANPGEMKGAGEEFASERVATGVVFAKKPNGQSDIFKDYSKMKVTGYDSEGGLTGESTVNSSGVFNLGNLQIDKEYDLKVKYEVSPGVEITIGEINVTISNSGEMNISTVLIDPYGVITDAKTGQIIQGAHVELYYADTVRNKNNNLTIGGLVNLPGLADFPPANNANPQNSDANGKYAFMVFPFTDYNVTATKDGYVNYISPVISVEGDIVMHNISMTVKTRENPGGATGGGGSSGSSSGSSTSTIPATIQPTIEQEKDIAVYILADKTKVQEADYTSITIKYINKTEILVNDVWITIELPKEMIIEQASGGKVKGNKITWSIGELKGLGKGSINFEVQIGKADTAENIIELKACIKAADKLVKLEDDCSNLQILLFSNDNISHKRYIKGYTDNTFRANSPITRGEIAAIFARIMNLEGTVKREQLYKDVKENYWAAEYIEAVTKKGLFKGTSKGSFEPAKSITRAEVATVIARYLGAEKEKDSGYYEKVFNDIEGNWAEGSIKEIYRYGILKGYADGTFKPANTIKRSECVAMINRMLFRGPLINVNPSFKDMREAEWSLGDVEEASRTHEAQIEKTGKENMTKYIPGPLW